MSPQNLGVKMGTCRDCQIITYRHCGHYSIFYCGTHKKGHKKRCTDKIDAIAIKTISSLKQTASSLSMPITISAKRVFAQRRVVRFAIEEKGLAKKIYAVSSKSFLFKERPVLFKAIKGMSWNEFVDFLQSSPTSLTLHFFGKDSNETFDAWLKCIGQFSSIKHLKIVSFPESLKKKYIFMDKHLQALSKVPRLRKKLETIDLQGCGGITREGLCDFKYFNQLNSLNLSNCKGVTGSVLEYLKDCTSLRSVLLDSCKSIFTYDLAFLKDSKIEKLGLSRCGLTDEVFHSLKQLKNLRSLDLRNNPELDWNRVRHLQDSICELQVFISSLGSGII